jgi:hypothetical protein
MSEPAGTIREVVLGLDRVVQELPPTDGMKWFARLYRDVTEAIEIAYDEGRFQVPRFMEGLVVRFGNAFFEAVDHPAGLSHAWNAVFSRRYDPDVAPIQFAIAGLNSHIGFELPLGLVAEWREFGVEPSDTSPQHADWQTVSATVRKVEPQAKHYLLTGAVKEVDRVFDGADDVVASWAVGEAREAAWAHGAALWRLWDDTELIGPYLATLDRSVGLVSKLLLVPTAV